MKKKQLSILLALTLLGTTVSACADTETPAPDSTVSTENDESGTEETTENEQTADGETAESDTNVTTSAPAETEENTALPSPVTVTFQETRDDIKADDGTVIVTNSVQMPVVSISGAEDIAKKSTRIWKNTIPPFPPTATGP